MIKIVNGVGHRNPPIAILGEAPGADEESQGHPFVGRSGQLINKIMQELDIDRTSCYITNVVKFRPEGNRTPTREEIVEWTPLLYEELKLINPTLIISLGAVAFKALSGMDNIKLTSHRGKIYDSSIIRKVDGSIKHIPYLVTFHPAYCLRNPNELPKLVEDFRKAKEYAL